MICKIAYTPANTLLEDLGKTSKFLETSFDALRMVQARIIMRKSRGVPATEEGVTAFATKLVALRAPRFSCRKILEVSLDLRRAVEGEVLLIIFPLKEKERDILRDSIQLGAIKV